MKAPVVIFTYNRWEEIMRVMEALAKNFSAKETDVYVFSNAPIPVVKGDEEKVVRIREDLMRFEGAFRTYTVVHREINEGSNANMYDGISQIVNKYGKVIVLEDDILTAPAFLSFMNQALDYFEKDEEVFSICGYNPVTLECELPGDSFSYDVFRSWGWATWKNRWESFSMDEPDFSKIDLRKSHTEAIMYRCGFQRDIGCPKNRATKFIDYRLTIKVMAENKTVIYSKRSWCDNIGMSGNGLTTREFSDYTNKNMAWDVPDTQFNFSKEKLSIDSDRKYFYRFRGEEFAIQAYEATNLNREIMYNDMYYALSRLLMKKGSIERYFTENKIKKIAIYGWGNAGMLLRELLENSSVEILCVVDRRDISKEIDLPAHQSALDIPKVDALIISSIRAFWEVEEQLYGKVDFPLISMDDVIYECLRKVEKKDEQVAC